MRGNKLPLSVVAAAISACAIEPESLNSERIEGRFGNYGIDVLSSGAGMRKSNLYSTDGGVQTCRTYAIVRFTDQSGALVDSEHQQILAGNSIGAIFKASGWSIHKQSLYTGTLRLDATTRRIADLMRIDVDSEVAMHTYRLLLEKDSQALDYATIIELHHPEYLDETQLTDIYVSGDNESAGPGQIEAFKALVMDAA